MFAGQYVSGMTPGVTFSNLEFRSVNSLASFAAGTPEAILFNSSGGRWAGLLDGTMLSLELLSVSSGLRVTDANGNDILVNPGDQWNLGEGNAGFSFTPTFVANTLGPHSARFRILDRGTGNAGGPWLQSGEFEFRFNAVPEPSSVILLGLGLGAVGLAAYRRRRRGVGENSEG
jgi:hypothetical protein